MLFLTPIPTFPQGRAERKEPARWAGLAKEPACGKPTQQTGLFVKIAHRAISKRSIPPWGETGKGGQLYTKLERGVNYTRNGKRGSIILEMGDGVHKNS